MSTTDIEQFDSRLWDVQRLLRAGQTERARVESALLAAEAELAGHDWVSEQLRALWVTAEQIQRSA